MTCSRQRRVTSAALPTGSTCSATSIVKKVDTLCSSPDPFPSDVRSSQLLL